MTVFIVFLIFSFIFDSRSIETYVNNDQIKTPKEFLNYVFNFETKTKIFPKPENYTTFMENISRLDEKMTMNGNPICGKETLGKRILHGKEADREQFPYVAELILKYESGSIGTCTGSLIKPQWILTARHCVHDKRDDVTDIVVLMGAANRHNSRQNTTVKRVVRIFSLFNPPDIALGELEKPFILDKFVNTINLAKQFHYNPDTIITVVGWGKVNDTGYSDVLQYTQLEIHNPAECIPQTGMNFLTSFCSQGAYGYTSLFHGDSGGPAILHSNEINETLIGVNVAILQDCGRVLWQLTTKVVPFLNWINRHTRMYDPIDMVTEADNMLK